MLINFVDATNDATHYTKPPPNVCTNYKNAKMGKCKNTKTTTYKMQKIYAKKSHFTHQCQIYKKILGKFLKLSKVIFKFVLSSSMLLH